MKLTQALKLKNKEVARLNALKQRLLKSNTYVEGSIPSYNSRALVREYEDQLAKVAHIKTVISEANRPIQHEIYELSELKGLIKTLQGLSTLTGPQSDGYRGVIQTFVSEISESEKDEMIEKYQERIEIIQERLDTFNATNSVEL